MKIMVDPQTTAQAAAAAAKPGLFTLHNLLIAAGAFIAVKLATRFLPAFNKQRKEGASTGTAAKNTFKSFIEPEPIIPVSSQLPQKSIGGLPYFYNEVDHTKGRFLGWVKYDEDKADIRKWKFYRARVNIDVRYLWVFKGAKEVVTPCVFRPGIDCIFKAPGEEEGIPPEGLMVFRRSMDGRRLGGDAVNRYRNILLDTQHKNSVLSDTLYALRDKERLMGSGDMMKETTDDLEIKMKRIRKMHDSAVGKNDRGMNQFANPYGQEMYGEEQQGMNPAGADSTWKFEG
jgi:hypothetical protein